MLVHNRYRPVAPSGEDRVVDQEAAALTARGHAVRLFERRSGDIAGWPLLRRATVPARVVWSEEARQDLARTLVGFAPDVVHVHNTFPLVSPSVLYACRDAGVPVVATLHNYRLGCAPGATFRDGRVCHDCLGGTPLPALVHACYRGSRAATLPIVVGQLVHARAWRTLVSAYIFSTAAERDVLATIGLPAGRCFVKPHFVTPPEGAPSGKSPGEPSGKEHEVVFVGRMDEGKGVPLLMAAWDLFRAARPGSALRLGVVGGGPLEPEVRRWAASHPTVTVSGMVPPERVFRILGRARAAVHATRVEETFGLVAVEAMVSGTASIAPAHGSYPELITPGSDGALFTPGDPRALAGLLAEVDDRPERWDRYGRQARLTWRERFTPGRVMDQLDDIYAFAAEHPT